MWPLTAASANSRAFASGITDATAEDIAVKLGLENRMDETKQVVKNLYQAFITHDASMIEINPYAEDTYGKS